MPAHEIGLLSTLVISLVAAFAGGLAVRAVNLPPLLGYLLAGILIGSLTPGIVANQAMATELAEIGVALMLFNIGLHFSFKDLLAVRSIAVPGAIFQVCLGAGIGSALAYFILDMSIGGAIVVGLSFAIASTAIATRILEEKRQVSALAGRVALGWLVMQDLIVIFALVLLPLLGASKDVSTSSLLTSLGQTALQITGFVAVMVFGGRRVIPALLGYVARRGSRELFTLAVIVIALGIAWGSALIFGVSLALGAFFAGVVIGESDLNHFAASEALSMQQVFTILFFVSVGMLFDPVSVTRMPLEILLFLLTIIIGMGFLTFVVLLFMRVPLHAAALVGGAFAQIGEFSFVLSEIGVRNDFYGTAERDLIMAVAILSILINPLILALSLRFANWVGENSLFCKWQNHWLDGHISEIEGAWDHTILVGHGRVGSIVATALREYGLPYITIETDRNLTEKLRLEGENVIYGDASREAVLSAAHPEKAKLLVLAVPDAYYARQIIKLAKRINPALDVVVRTHSDEEARSMTRMGVGLAVMGEREIAFGISYYALQKLGIEPEETRKTIGEMRAHVYKGDQPEATATH